MSMVDFKFNSDIYREAGVQKNKVFTLLLPTDTRSKLENVKRDDISLGEAIRQILDAFLNIERPLRDSHIHIAPTETYYKTHSKKKVDEFDFL